MHGYCEFSGYEQMYELIRHTVRKGSIVDLPALADRHRDPMPGPFNIEPCIDSAVNGIRGALRYLRASPNAGAAAGRPSELLRLLLRRDHHREPRQPLAVA